MRSETHQPNTLRHLGLRLLIPTALMVCTGMVNAQRITITTGGADLLAQAPDNLFRGNPMLVSDTLTRLYLEQFDFVHGAPLKVDARLDNFGAGSVTFGFGGLALGSNHLATLAANQPFDVYMFCFDRATMVSPQEFSEGSVTFSEEIVAVQFLKNSLIGDLGFGGDPLLGHPDTEYPGTPATGGVGGDPNVQPHRERGLENGSNDRLEISADRKTLTFKLAVKRYPDQFRVITRPYEASVFDYFCAGETGCPCGNNSSVGSGRGCANSNGDGAKLTADGEPNVTLSSPTLQLRISGMPANRFCILFTGDGFEASAVPFGDGLRCVKPAPGSPSFFRSFVSSSGPSGVANYDDVVASFNGASILLPGATLGFQGYYRDPNTGNCTAGQGFNLTNAVRMTFQ